MIDAPTAAVIVSGMALAATIFTSVFGGGWRMSGRLSSIESNLGGMQAEIKKLSDVMVKLADMRGDYRVLDSRMASLENRVTIAEQHVDDLRRGRGWIRVVDRAGLDGEYP